MPEFKKSESGNVVAYLFLALFLSGLLIATVMQDTGISASSTKLKEIKAAVRADIRMAEAGITECILSYPDPVDVNGNGVIDTTDNPNAPYPVYGDNSTGGAGDNILDIRCPGSGQTLFTSDTGRFFRLVDTGTYTADYINSAGEGIQILFNSNLDTSAWDEALQQISAENTDCKTEYENTGALCETGSCLTYWIKRNSTCP